jgi:hypothetical protein
MWAIKRYNTLTGKNEVKFLRHKTDDDDKSTLITLAISHGGRLIQLPCGQCTECRLARSREWATRCMLESKEHKQNYFITLTYDEEHLPKGQAIETTTGEIYEVGTLNDKDMQEFWKRLRITWKRKYNIENIRYYYCGEYGETYGRPHYHAICFGLPIYDLKTDHKSKKGNMNYISKEIEKIWGKGRVAIGTVTWDSCAYTARYIMKKQTGKGNEEYYKILGVKPEFVRMSRRPGIGKNYYENNKDSIYDIDGIYISTKKGVQKIKPSKYYDKLYDIDNHERLENIKEARKATAELTEQQITRSTDMTAREIRETKEQSKKIAQRTLKRNYEIGKSQFKQN